MRGKSVSMDGLGEVPDFDYRSSFYVPGERHENLPAGGFAGEPSYPTMGTPVQTLIPDTRAPEYATGGSGMFQGADFGHGKLIALHGPRRRRNLGQDDSDSGGTSFMDMLSQGLSTVSDVAQAVGPQQAQASSAPAPVASAAPRALSPAQGGIMSKKIMGLPAVAVIAIVGVGGFFAYKSMKKRR
jgi:hypothetical protein